MSKTKTNVNTSADQLGDFAQKAGFVLMTVAATIGMFEMPDHPNKRAIVPTQPAFAYAPAAGEENNNPLRREREEAGPHYVSYSVNQRTPGRTGRL
jgi:hypothetical protein